MFFNKIANFGLIQKNTCQLTRGLHKTSSVTCDNSYFKFLKSTTTKLEFGHQPDKIIPTLQLLDPAGEMVCKKSISTQPQLELYRQILEKAVRMTVFDKILYESQRQGRISFYMQCSGEEISVIGSSAALHPKDLIFSQYREVGALLWRGFSERLMVHQLFGSQLDLTKGRQMPMHYSSPEHHFVSVSSPLGTQIPQAVGAAYSYKMKKSDNIVACYFGDGAASEGDFHAAMNMASVLECPVLFLCRNNQFAISTTVNDQYRGDGIAYRAYGYGVASIRVDGNDVIAVTNAVSQARDYCLKNSKPLLIELITYRVGHHSTSDDSSAYRDQQKTLQIDTDYNGIHRLSKLLTKHGMWSDDIAKTVKDETRKSIVELIKEAENTKFHPIDEAFNDVYDEMTSRLAEQKQQVMQLLKQDKKYTRFLDSYETHSKSQVGK